MSMSLYGADDFFEVSGEDYVGANFIAPYNRSAPPKLLQPGSASAHMALANLGAKVAQQQQKTQRLRQLAYSGMIPQIPMGVRNNSVAAGGTANISPEPGVPLRITNFVVTPTIAGLFLITQITVARVNMLAGSDAVPATLFTPDARHPPFENPILAAGSQIVVGVENIDGAAHPFFGAFLGIDLTPPYARMI